MLKAPLEDSTAVRMRREVVHVSTEGTDKRQTIGGDALDQLLDDVVAVGVLDTLEHVRIDFLDERRLLFG